MDAAGTRRLKLIAGDGAVNQAADFKRIDRGGLNRLATAGDAFFARPRAAGPQPPLADAAHQLQATLRQPQPAIEGREPPLDVVTADDFVRERISERFDADGPVAHSFKIGGKCKTVNRVA